MPRGCGCASSWRWSSSSPPSWCRSMARPSRCRTRSTIWRRAIASAGTLIVALVVGYAAARFGSTLFDNLRNAVFERVGQDATRRLAAAVFRHLHQLSLRFHLDRRTGAVTKVVERGTKSIDTMLYFLLFNIAPTVLELALVVQIFWTRFGAWLVAVDAGDGGRLYRLHPHGDRLAQRAARADERSRHAARSRMRSIRCSTSRRSNISTPRSARRERYDARDHRLCQCRGEERDLARLAQHRPVADHQPDDGGRHGAGRLGLGGAPLHARRRGAGQHAARPAVPPARSARHGLSHDPAGADRHGGDVRSDRHARRGGRRARCAAAHRAARPCPLRSRALRL